MRNQIYILRNIVTSKVVKKVKIPPLEWKFLFILFRSLFTLEENSLEPNKTLIKLFKKKKKKDSLKKNNKRNYNSKQV